MNSELATDHCTEDLEDINTSYPIQKMYCLDVLAQMVIVSTSLALTEQDRHALSHVNSKKSIPVSDDAGECGKCHCFGDRVVSQMLPAECGPLHIELDHEGAVETLHT